MGWIPIGHLQSFLSDNLLRYKIQTYQHHQSDWFTVTKNYFWLTAGSLAFYYCFKIKFNGHATTYIKAQSVEWNTLVCLLYLFQLYHYSINQYQAVNPLLQSATHLLPLETPLLQSLWTMWIHFCKLLHLWYNLWVPLQQSVPIVIQPVTILLLFFSSSVTLYYVPMLLCSVYPLLQSAAPLLHYVPTL